MKSIVSVILTVLWVCGIVIANGFWSTFFAIFVPLWAWYVAVEHFLRHFAVI